MPQHRNTRTIAAKAAAFTAALIIAVTGVGAPSYTSGRPHVERHGGDLEAETGAMSARPQ